MVNETINKFNMNKSEFKHFAGIDISKQTLDVALVSTDHPGEFVCIQFSNNPSGLKQLSNWIKELKLKLSDILFCMESTGVYGLPIQNHLVKKNAFVWVEMAVQILRSIGLQRGKNDQVDAKRIAEYAMRYQDRRVQWIPTPKEQAELNDLMNLRGQLIIMKNMLLAPIKELKSVGEMQRTKLLENSCRHTLKGIEGEITAIEKKIDELLKSVSTINNNIALVTSIPGIGKWTALAFVLATNNFSHKMTARQLASYCGCAPFEHQSGSSVRGKTRVSHMANKTLKKLLTLCARSLINMKNELAEYYRRKVAEGKNKMSVINALRNKLIHRICAVIERQTPYLSSL